MEHPIKFQLRIKAKKTEYFTSFDDFSTRLSALRRNRESVTPLVGFKRTNPQNDNDIRWEKYSEYKKLKKKEENALW